MDRTDPWMRIRRLAAGMLTRAVLIAVLLFPIALSASGLWLLAQVELGPRVRADVLSCESHSGYRSYTRHCLARWSVDGVEMTGPIEASGDGDVGNTVSATERNGVLYRTSRALPLVLTGLGLPLCWFPAAWLHHRVGRDRGARSVGRRTPEAGEAPSTPFPHRH